jgi:XapX domain-containing protein
MRLSRGVTVPASMERAMKAYLLSLGVGMLASTLYALLSVRSPAPPVIALLGLLGMLIGEQAASRVRGMIERRSIVANAVPQRLQTAIDRRARADEAGRNP